MSVRVESGPARVVASGQCTSFLGHPLRLVLNLDGLGAYSVAFHLRDDDDDPSIRVDSRVESWGISLDLYNFREVVAKGSGVPVLLGEAGGSLYFLHFRVWRTGRTPDATVHYTIYASSREGVGWVDAAAPADPAR